MTVEMSAPEAATIRGSSHDSEGAHDTQPIIRRIKRQAVAKTIEADAEGYVIGSWNPKVEIPSDQSMHLAPFTDADGGKNGH